MNDGCDFLNIAYHLDTGETSRVFCCWNVVTGVSGSYRFSLMLSTIRRTQILPTFLSRVGLVQYFMGAVGLENAVRGTWMRRLPEHPSFRCLDVADATSSKSWVDRFYPFAQQSWVTSVGLNQVDFFAALTETCVRPRCSPLSVRFLVLLFFGFYQCFFVSCSIDRTLQSPVVFLPSYSPLEVPLS